jgi:Peptidase M15/Fungal cellulose binding domain
VISKYFASGEVDCNCGCGFVPNDQTMEIADKLREGWGGPLRCVSGARCKAYNKYLIMTNVPAAPKSAHIDGQALDLRPVDGRIKEFQEYVKGRLEELNIRMESPIDAPTWVHVDTRPVAPGKKRVFRK